MTTPEPLETPPPAPTPEPEAGREPAEPAPEPASEQPAPLDAQDIELLAAVGGTPEDLTQLQLKVLGRLSPTAKDRLIWMVGNWPGRVAFRCAAGLRHLQIFDRSMTIAAQMFTSVFPIIIMGASIFGGRSASQAIGGSGLPQDAENVLDDVVNAGGFGTFGVVGILIVLVSATSLSRALTRAYDTVWRHGRTKLPPKGMWRWLAAVMVLALSVVLSHKLITLVKQVPPPDVWGLLAVFAVPALIASYVPWMLMAGRVPLRLLLPGAAMFGILMVLAHPFADRYLSTSISVSAERFGPIGVAFTYLTYLYCVSWVLLGTAVLGRVLAIDPGILGRLIRGPLSVPEWEASDDEDDFRL